MEQSRLQELLDRYWQGETTLEEELELKQYFKDNKESYDDAAVPFFEYIHEEKNVSLPDDFNRKLQATIIKKQTSIKWIYPLLKIAAALLITLSAIYFFLPDRKVNSVAFSETDTYSDPQQAYDETRKALLLISNHLNTGSNYIEEVGKLNKAEELIHSKTN